MVSFSYIHLVDSFTATQRNEDTGDIHVPALATLSVKLVLFSFLTFLRLQFLRFEHYLYSECDESCLRFIHRSQKTFGQSRNILCSWYALLLSYFLSFRLFKKETMVLSDTRAEQQVAAKQPFVIRFAAEAKTIFPLARALLMRELALFP